MASATEIRGAVTETEVPTTEYWRGVMARRRKELGLGQVELANCVGTSQYTISAIETGEQGQSKFVSAISVALGIPLPHVMIEDEYDQRWIEVGRVLRHRSRKLFMKYLDLFETEAGENEPDS